MSHPADGAASLADVSLTVAGAGAGAGAGSGGGMPSMAALTGMGPTVISVYREGAEAGTKSRIRVPESWDAFIALLSRTLEMGTIGKITDETGARIEYLEVIRDGDVLCVTDSLTTTPVLRRASSSGSSMQPAPTTGGRADVLDIQILGCATVSDFELLEPVAGGQNGFIFKARCTRDGLSRPDKLYALKMVYNFGVATNAVRNTFENEYRVLSQLPPHPNATRFWAQFLDEVPESVIPHMPPFMQEQARYTDHRGVERKRKCQFLVVDYHPMTLQKRLESGDLTADRVIRYALELAKAVDHFTNHAVAHLDLKLDNILVADDDHVVVCDFGTAVRFRDSTMTLDYVPGMSVGGNQMHLAPEVLNRFDELRRKNTSGTISYFRQGTFALGVLIFELATGRPPWPDYPSDCGGVGKVAYDTAALPELSSDYPDDFRELLPRMLALDPEERPGPDAVLAHLTACAEEMGGGGALPPGAKGDDSGPVMFGSSRDEPGIDVNLKAVDGRTATVRVPLHATVADLKRTGAEALHADKDPATHTYMLLSAGTQVDDALQVSTLTSGVAKTWFHIVALSSSSALSEERHRAAGDDFCCAGFDAIHKSAFLTISPDRQRVSSVQWGSVRLALCEGYWMGGHRKYSWALKVINKAVAGGICIGVCTRDFDAKRKNVGAARGSWGYSSSGKKSAGTPSFQAYSVGFTTGDVIRCDLDLEARTLSFALNGVDLGVAFENLPAEGLYPALCMGATGTGVGLAAHQLELIRTRHEYNSLVAEKGHVEETEDGADAEVKTPDKEDFLFSAEGSSVNVDVSQDGSVASVAKWGSVVLRYPVMKPGSGIHVFRFKVVARAGHGGICIGVANQLFNAELKNVGAAPHSWGYSSSGKKGVGQPRFIPYGSSFKTGDVIGMIVDSVRGTVRFSLNGEDQGVAVKGLEAQSLRVVVCAGGCKPGETHRVMALEVPRVFDPATKVGGISILAGGTSVKAVSAGVVCLHHAGMSAGQHAWKLKVACASQEPMYIGVVDKEMVEKMEGAPALTGGYYYAAHGRKTGAGMPTEHSMLAYGSQFTTDDEIGVLLDADEGTLRFSKNGMDQGVAFRGLKGRVLLPGIAMGGRKSFPSTHSVELLPSIDAPIATKGRRFDTSLRNVFVTLSTDHMTASGVAWGSFAIAGGVLNSGVHQFRFKIDHKATNGGICIGVASASFDVTTKNVAAAAGSWGYSSSGKKNNGSPTFSQYGASYTTGDIVEMLLDMDNGRLSFSKNGVPQGIAFTDLAGQRVVPACCVGGARLPEAHTLTILPTGPAVTGGLASRIVKFSPFLKHRSVVISDDQLSVAMISWGSVVLEQGGMSSGRHEFKFVIEQKAMSGGVCVGVIDHAEFDATTKNVGAAPNSWGFSSSGKKSAGMPTFVEYARGYSTGDIVGVVVDMDVGTISFSVNEEDMGVAFAEGIKGRTLIPAVCGGGASGGQTHRIRVLEPAANFDVDAAAPHVEFKNDDTTIIGSREWGSASLKHGGMTHGKYSWAMRVDKKAKAGGICIGVVDFDRFNFSINNVGADRHSWGYSSLGKKGDGSPEFDKYGAPFGTGDIVSVLLDMDAGTLRFFKNGADQGIAFDSGLKGKHIVPAVCIGGARASASSGGAAHIVSIVSQNIQSL